jgi:hypothetical protein
MQFALSICLSWGLAQDSNREFSYADLQPYSNFKLAEPVGGNNRAELGEGEKSLAGVKFYIGEGFVQLGSTVYREAPDKITGIKIGKLCDTLHLLHATGYGGGSEGSPTFVADGTPIGRYVVKYEDKSEQVIPIVYGEDVRDWWNWDNSKPVTRGELAWTGSNPVVSLQNLTIRLYLATWKNPKPDTKITEIDYLSAGDTPAAPFCVAITTEYLLLRPGFRWLSSRTGLDGWHNSRQPIESGRGGRWTMEDAAIIGEQAPHAGGDGGILLSEEKFGDLELMFEVKPDWGVSSGFSLRSSQSGQGYQVMIDYHDAGNIGEIRREGLDGARNQTFQIHGIYQDDSKNTLKGIRLTPTPATMPEDQGAPTPADWLRLWKLDDWNNVRIRIEGNPPLIATWVNGQSVTKYISDQKFEGVLGDRGSLGLQVHSGKGWPKGAKVRIRNIQVMELDLAEPGN